MSIWSLWSLWEFVSSSATLATLIGAGAVAIAVLTPPLVARFIPNLRLTAIVVAIAAFSYTSVAGKFYHDGLSVRQSEWDASLAKEAEDGEQVHEDAVRDVRDASPDSVRNDPRNRERRKQQSGK